VVCLSRSALALFPCTHFPPSILQETLKMSAAYNAATTMPMATSTKTMNCPIPARFRPALSCPRPPPPPTSLEGVGSVPASTPAPTPAAWNTATTTATTTATAAVAAAADSVTLSVMTTGSSVDRIVSVAVSSLMLTVAEMDSGR
ncbi:unnamed protein product, partial [Laminaria digitata]